MSSYAPCQQGRVATTPLTPKRCAGCWSQLVKVFGTGQAHDRAACAVERTLPFQLVCQAIATVWHATAGRPG